MTYNPAIAAAVAISALISGCADAATHRSMATPTASDQYEALDELLGPPITAYPPPRLATETAEHNREGTAATTGRQVIIQARDMISTSNSTLGLSFSYPRDLGELTFAFQAGDTGSSYSGNFSKYDSLWIEGRSSDFTLARGGWWGDTLGFASDARGQYFWRRVADPTGQAFPISPSTVVATQQGEIVLFEAGSSRSDHLLELAPGSEAALINLRGSQYPGLIIVNGETGRLPHSTFLEILTSMSTWQPQGLKISSPAETRASATPELVPSIEAQHAPVEATLEPISTETLRGHSMSVPPKSKPAFVGKSYGFKTGHCGIYSWIDFDGSYWLPTAMSGRQGQQANRETVGRLRLLDRETLEFESDEGFRARFRRDREMLWYWFCM